MHANTVSTIPPDLVDTVQTHGEVVVAADNRAILADFLPDRVGQLISATNVPADLENSVLQSIRDVGQGNYDAVIRYSHSNGEWFELRSRWVKFTDDTWRVATVRNIPATPPWVDLTGPSPDGLDTPHWEGLREGKLILQRCAQCSRWIWSPRLMCSACRSFEMEWQPVEPAGTIYSWTRTWQSYHPSCRGHLPYVVALVELPGAGGRRVLGTLADIDQEDPVIGAPVRGEVHHPPDDALWPLIRWHL